MKATYRETVELREHELLSADACFSDASEGRSSSSSRDLLRTEFQRDRDKIIHSKAFRRLSHKTQVFLSPEGDHFRTRLTHTLEVAQISRTIARGLSLNEDLVEAIALGHDLGHTPFGHTGEEALNDCLTAHAGETQKLSFRHNEQSLRVVDLIENDGRGLNLTSEVRDGILCHTGDIPSETLEGRIVALSDRIAYVNHDIDDAIRAGILTEQALPDSTHSLLGPDHSARIQNLVLDTISASAQAGDICMSDDIFKAMSELRSFLFDEVYRSEPVMKEVRKAYHLVQDLFRYYLKHFDDVPQEYVRINPDDKISAVCDYVAGMTDRYARAVFEELFIPHAVRI